MAQSLLPQATMPSNSLITASAHLASGSRSMLGSHSPSKFSIRHDAVKQKKDTNQYQQDSPDSPPVRRQAQPEIVSDGGQHGIRSAQGAKTRGDSGNDGSSITSFHRSLHQNTRGRLGGGS